MEDETTTETIKSLLAELVDSVIADIEAGLLTDVVISVAIILLVVLFGGKVVRAVTRWLKNRTESPYAVSVLDTVQSQLINLVKVAGIQFATLRLFRYFDNFLMSALDTVFFVLYWYLFTVLAWRLLDFSLDWYVERMRTEKESDSADQLEPLARRAIHALIVITAGVTLLGHFGVSILVMTGALGLTGFAIGLAAKDTISNMISGVVIMIDNPFRNGDRIYITSVDAWADVTDIGLRSTKVLTRDNRSVIVPNTTIVDGTVTNYSMPDPSYRLETDVGIGSEVDIPRTVQVLTEAVRRVDSVLQDRPVDVLFTEFGDSSSTFRIRWWVASYSEKRSSSHEVNTAIQVTALEAGIDMPNPIFALDGNIRIREKGSNGASPSLPVAD